LARAARREREARALPRRLGRRAAAGGRRVPGRGRARPAALARRRLAAGSGGRRAPHTRGRSRQGHLTAGAVQQVPLLLGSRIARIDVPENGIVLRPPAPRVELDDVGAAVRQALRFPLAGRPLSELVTRDGTATVVIEVPTLPIPTAAPEPRHEAISATVDELERLGVRRVTILVASGLLRRPSSREIGFFVAPEFRRRFRGTVIVHDAEAEDLVE